VPIAVTERLAHPRLAGAFVVVPGVVEERYALIDGIANEAEAELLIHVRESEVPATEPDGRDSFAGASERAVLHDLRAVHGRGQARERRERQTRRSPTWCVSNWSSAISDRQTRLDGHSPA